MKTENTMTLSELGRYVFDCARRSTTAIDVDVATLVAAAVDGDCSGLQSLFDAAFSDANAVDKGARPAVTAAWTLVSKRAYWHAGQAGYRLTWPRLDGKGSTLTPTLTLKSDAAAADKAAAAVANEQRERALAEHKARQESAAALALASLTLDDIVAAALAACEASGVNPADVARVLADVAAVDAAVAESVTVA
jgi:hypothetical protein